MKVQALRRFLPFMIVFALFMGANQDVAVAQTSQIDKCESMYFLYGGFVSIHAQDSFQLLTITAGPAGRDGLQATESGELCRTEKYDFEVPSGILLTSTPSWVDQYGMAIACQKSVGYTTEGTELVTWNCPEITTAGELRISVKAQPQALGRHQVVLKWDQASVIRTILVRETYMVLTPFVLQGEMAAQ